MEHIDNPLEAAIEQRARETAARRRNRRMAAAGLGGVAVVAFAGVLTFTRLLATQAVGAGPAQHSVAQTPTEAPVLYGGPQPARAPRSGTEATEVSLRRAGPTRPRAVRVRRPAAPRRGQVATVVPRSSPAPPESHQSP